MKVVNFISMLRTVKHHLILWSSIPGLVGILGITGCAYFNTFYNAEQYFLKAEDTRLKKAGEILPVAAAEDYSKVIEKSQSILDQYSSSKYRPKAYLLIGKSRYHRREYALAKDAFENAVREDKKVAETVGYWLALIKWKEGKAVTALSDLETLLEATADRSLKSQIHLSIAEIFLDLENTDEALNHLESGAALTRDRNQKGEIYYRLSTLAYERNEYDRALKAFENVISYSLSKKRIEEAHLSSVRILRRKGDLKTVAEKIRVMLLDEKFKTIHGDLELELAKIYLSQGQMDSYLNRLLSIVQEYPRSPISAEAYFLMGEHHLSRDWAPETAKKYFDKTTKESRLSLFSTEAQMRVKEITAYTTTWKDFETQSAEWEQLAVAEPDTAGFDSIHIQTRKGETRRILADKLYTLGELEAFHFHQRDSALTRFNTLIHDFPESERVPKALFSASYLLMEMADTSEGLAIQNRILEEYPQSEFATYIRQQRNLSEDVSTVLSVLKKGESLWPVNPVGALEQYKQTLHLDSTSEISARAAYFLAFQYDQTFNDPDSAYKYYLWLESHHPESEQAILSQTRISFLRSLLETQETDSTSGKQ